MMNVLTPLTNTTRYVWVDGEFVIHFNVKDCAYQYQMYHGGIVVPV